MSYWGDMEDLNACYEAVHALRKAIEDAKAAQSSPSIIQALESSLHAAESEAHSISAPYCGRGSFDDSRPRSRWRLSDETRRALAEARENIESHLAEKPLSEEGGRDGRLG